jgi:uncharacterized cupin superfamily protein
MVAAPSHAISARPDTVPPGKRSCRYHFHRAQEERFVILEGARTLRVAGATLPVRAGDVICTPPVPEYPHQIIDTSEAPLPCRSIGAQERPEVCEYPDSGKVVAFIRGRLLVHRKADTLDCRDGEP